MKELVHFLRKEFPNSLENRILRMKNYKIGVLGAGTMGAGIAQIAAQHGHETVLVDINDQQLNKAEISIEKVWLRLVEKGAMTQAKLDSSLRLLKYSSKFDDFTGCDLVIEAIVEKIEVKHLVFKQIETFVDENCIIASNTSSLSIASIGSALEIPSRVIGIHFFNPAPLMPLVEIIPAVQSSQKTVDISKELIASWNKTVVLCKDTPGFIVNRVARPFYGEALRIYEEGIANFETIDWAMTEIGGFKMGPFTLMDYIGNDINYTVTESVFAAFYFDPRFKPSFTQKRHMEAGFLGRKTNRGFYDYSSDKIQNINEDLILGKQIVDRIVAMLINEAYDALYLNVASAEDIDVAITKGVNYPKGLLKWSEEIGIENVLQTLENLFNLYGEDRYRPNVLLKKKVKELNLS